MPHHQLCVLLVIVSLAPFAQGIGSAGGDLYNNIFSDLGPLISLFGEQATIQFLSQALSLADCIIVAVAPLGIITILTSAIRVGGLPWLKAIIGRASENMLTVEKDLLFSTSNEICELWNGKNVVRCQGSANICEFIVLWPENLDENANPEVNIMEVGSNKNSFLNEKEPSRWTRFRKAMIRIASSTRKKKVGDEEGLRVLRISTLSNSKPHTSYFESPMPESGSSDIRVLYEKTSPPNMFLNRHNSVSRYEIYCVAVISFLLQLAVLLFYGLMTYHPRIKLKFRVEHRPTLEYSFYLTTIGTVLLSAGLLICAHVIQKKTERHRYSVHKGQRAQVIWLQQGGVVSDQQFEPFAIYLRDNRESFVTSRRRLGKRERTITGEITVLDEEGFGWELHTETLLGTAIGIIGYILQLIGLRGMHWVAAVIQFAFTIVMTALRTGLRREASETLGSLKLPSDFQLDWLVMSVVNIGSAEWFRVLKDPVSSQSVPQDATTSNDGRKGSGKDLITWTIVSGSNCGETNYEEIKRVREDMECSISESITSSALAPASTRSSTIMSSDGKSLEHTSKAQKVMNIRKKLCEVVEWKSPVSSWSLSLARAIEGAMEILFPKHGDSIREYTWVIDVMHDNKPSKVSLDLNQSNRGIWAADVNQINAALSLWLYSVKNQGGPDSGWERWCSLRLLGPKEENCLLGLMRHLEWWSPEGLSRLSVVERTEITSGGITKPQSGLERVNHLFIENRQVVGCSSNKLDNNAKPGDMTEWAWCYAETYEQDMASCLEEANEGNHESEDHLGDCKRGATSGTKSTFTKLAKANLAVECYEPPEKLYAIDLLFAFMCAAARTLKKPVEGDIEIKRSPIEGPSGWEYYTLWNKNLDKLAKVFERNGFGSVSEVYSTIIIPPLSMMEKLPDSTPLLRLWIEAANEYEKGQDWQNAMGMYLHLWKQTRIFRHDLNYLYTKAAAASMGYLARIQEELELRAAEKRATYQLEEYANTIEDALQLRNLNSNPFLWTLMGLYKQQGRPWKWNDYEDMDFAENGTEPNGTYLNQLHLYAMNAESSKFSQGDLDRLSKDVAKELVQQQDVCDWTPLHYAAALNNETAMSHILAMEGVDHNAKDLRGWTPLHYACLRGHREIVTELLANGALITVQGVDGVTPMHCAVMSKDQKVMEVVLRHVPDDKHSKLLDFNGRSLIHWVAIIGDVETVMFFESGFMVKDIELRTPLHLATIHNRTGIMKLLLENLNVDRDPIDSKGRTPLSLAAEWGILDAVKVLVDNDAKIDFKGKAVGAPLCYAVLNEHLNIVEFLLDRGASITAGSATKKNMIYTAASSCTIEMMELLLKKRPKDINEVETRLNYTPLAAAANTGRAEIIKLLLSHGADVSIKDIANNSPLHIAACSDNSEDLMGTVTQLLEAGVDPMDRNKQGKTALDLAKTRLSELKDKKVKDSKKKRPNLKGEDYNFDEEREVISLLEEAMKRRDSQTAQNTQGQQASD